MQGRSELITFFLFRFSASLFAAAGAPTGSVLDAPDALGSLRCCAICRLLALVLWRLIPVSMSLSFALLPWRGVSARRQQETPQGRIVRGRRNEWHPTSEKQLLGEAGHAAHRSATIQRGRASEGAGWPRHLRACTATAASQLGLALHLPSTCCATSCQGA